MFENLTQRERILALAVLALVPITFLFIGVMSFVNAYNANVEEQMQIAGQIKTERQKMLDGANAAKRQNYYTSVSLPPSLNAASNEYQQWLKQLLEEVQLDVTTVKPSSEGVITVKPGQPPIARTKTINVQATGDLQQLNEFLARFYEVDLLHRIDTLRINPLTEGTGSKQTRNGQLKLFFGIEIMSLAEGQSRDDFTEKLTERNRDDYAHILKRNIFGPANNAPIVRVRPGSYTVGRDASFDVSADDADKSDLLSFELIESSVDEAALEQKRPDDRRARFTLPSQEPGTYEFKVKVTDSGLPAKESIETFAVTFKPEPEPPAPPADPPKPPPFKYSTETRITGIAQDRAGDWRAWIFVRPLNQRYKLKVGETFELDDMTWKVTQILEDEVFLEADGKRYVARPNWKDRGRLIKISDEDEEVKKTEVDESELD